MDHKFSYILGQRFLCLIFLFLRLYLLTFLCTRKRKRYLNLLRLLTPTSIWSGDRIKYADSLLTAAYQPCKCCTPCWKKEDMFSINYTWNMSGIFSSLPKENLLKRELKNCWFIVNEKKYHKKGKEQKSFIFILRWYYPPFVVLFSSSQSYCCRLFVLELLQRMV